MKALILSLAMACASPAAQAFSIKCEEQAPSTTSFVLIVDEATGKTAVETFEADEVSTPWRGFASLGFITEQTRLAGANTVEVIAVEKYPTRLGLRFKSKLVGFGFGHMFGSAEIAKTDGSLWTQFLVSCHPIDLVKSPSPISASQALHQCSDGNWKVHCR